MPRNFCKSTQPWQWYYSLPAAQWIPAPPSCCLCCVHWWWCTSAGLFSPTTFSGGEVLIPMWPFSGSLAASNPSNRLASLLPHGSPRPTYTDTAYQRTLLEHCSSNFSTLPPDLSLARLVLLLSPFNLKLFLWSLLSPVHEYIHNSIYVFYTYFLCKFLVGFLLNICGKLM